jgi:MFS family permease
MTTQAAPPETANHSPAAYRWRWIALLVVLCAEVMDLLDSLVTSIAGPSITRDLGGGGVTIQWLSAGYTLAMAAGLLVGGRLGDMFGRKRMFLVGMAGFTVFSLLCAGAQDPAMLIGCRALQGLLGAILLPQGLGIINEMFPPEERAKAFGAFGPIMGLGAVGGPDPCRLADRRRPRRSGLAGDLRDQHPDRGRRAHRSRPLSAEESS